MFDDKYLKEIFSRKDLIKYAILLVLSIFMVGLSIAQPYLFKQVLDNILYSTDLKIFNKYIAIFLTTFISCQLIIGLYEIIKVKLTENILLSLRCKAYRSIIFKEIEFFNSMNTGEILNRILNELSNIITFIIDCTLKIITTLITVLGLLVAMFILDMNLAITTVILSLPYLVVMFILSPIYKKNENKIITNYSEVTDELHENILNIKTIKYLNLYDYVIKKVKASFNKYKNIKIHYAKIKTFTNILMSVLAYLPYIAIMYLGFLNVHKGLITVGTIMALTTYLQQLITQFDTIKNINIQFQQFKVLKQRLDRILSELIQEKESIYEKKFVHNKETNITVKDLTIELNNTNLFNISTNFQQGDIVLITGCNGSGKTTFINLLCGLIKSHINSIQINDINIENINPRDRKKLFAVLPQKVELFSGTVRENLILDRDISDEEILSLANKINFLKMDKKLLDKKILVRGMNLSGGQIQKIGVLRTILTDSKIMIFDESSSFIDLDGKSKFYSYINEIRNSHIIIVVSNEENKNFDYNKEINIHNFSIK